MYTQEMATAFHMIKAPAGFAVEIMDCDNFLSINVDPNLLISLDHETQLAAVDYINAVKKAFEQLGAIVLISRDTVE